MPIRVLQVVRPAAGGIRQHVLGLIDGLDPARVTVSVAAPGGFVQDAISHPCLHAGIPLDIRPRVSPLHDLHAARRLASLLPQFADIIHAHGVRAAWVAMLSMYSKATCPVPLIFTAHNLIEHDLASRLALPLIARRCVGMIAVSPSVRDSLTACGVPTQKIFVIPNGVDVEAFAPSALLSRLTARKMLGVPENAFVAVAVARLSPEKGLDILLEAARQRLGLTVLIAGDGPLLEGLSKSAPSNVRFLGRLADTRPLLAAADVGVIPSRREGQGIAALEAMAAGVPVIASAVGGLADMLTEGETALLVPPGDPNALAAALSRLQSDSRLRVRLATNAAALVRSGYSSAKMLQDMTDLYEKLEPDILSHEKLRHEKKI